MKLTLSLCCAVLAAAAAHAQVPVPGHRPGGGYIHRESPAVYAGFGYGHRDFGHRPGIGHRSYGPWSHHPGRPGHSYGYYRPRATVRIGYGYHPGYDYGYYPAYGYYPDYGYGSYGASGLFWGGLAGAIIGHNSGTFRHDAWRGAAWGAGAGWLLGTIADASRRAVASEPAAVSAAPVAAVPAAALSQPVTIINNYYHAPATPMSAANGLFGR